MDTTQKIVEIDVRRLVFPLIAGTQKPEGFHRAGLLGTAFFISRRGLALSAAHVTLGLAPGMEMRAALPSATGPMIPAKVLWVKHLPSSDIAVMRVHAPPFPCFVTRFVSPPMGQEVETTAPAESLFVTDSEGETKIALRVLKGYASHGESDWLAASFALPKGMSGAPLIVTEAEAQYVAGVFVGQTRGEEIEDQIEEVIDDRNGARRTHIERISRVEYFARGELLTRFRDFMSPEFGGLSLHDLIQSECLPDDTELPSAPTRIG